MVFQGEGAVTSYIATAARSDPLLQDFSVKTQCGPLVLTEKASCATSRIVGRGGSRIFDGIFDGIREGAEC